MENALGKYYKTIYESKPRLKFCEKFKDTSSTWNYTSHSHPYIEMMYFLDGKGKVEVSGTRMNVSLYDTIVYPANCIHQDGFISEIEREVICLWIDIPDLVLDKTLHLYERDNILGMGFKMIYQESKSEAPNLFMMEHALKLLLTFVVREANDVSKKKQFINRTIQYIHENYTEKITVEKLADLEHVSKSYLSRKFKQYTGVSIITFLNQRRVEESQQLLINTE